MKEHLGFGPSWCAPLEGSVTPLHMTHWPFNCGSTSPYTPQCPFLIEREKKNTHFFKDIKNLLGTSVVAGGISALKTSLQVVKTINPWARGNRWPRRSVVVPFPCAQTHIWRFSLCGQLWAVTPSALQPETSLLSDSDSPQWNNHNHSNQHRLQSLLLNYSYYLVLKKKKRKPKN